MNEKSNLQTNKCFSGSLPDEGLLKPDQRQVCFLDALKITTDFYKENCHKILFMLCLLTMKKFNNHMKTYMMTALSSYACL